MLAILHPKKGSYMNSSYFIKYLLIAFVISAIVVVYNWISPTGHIYGVWAGIKFFVVMGLGTGVGMFIGNAIRLAIMPDYITTREGAIGLIQAKLFWAIGPQVIGWFVGLIPVYSFFYG
ncbi:hypothetical protein R5M08_004079 [Providencia rettgeri]|nr:hypothetical protein [Providencia rettgeri]ELS4585881.1 hypothetical protein [Providencia rettgeri]